MADKRSNLRGQLYKNEAKNTPGKKLDEEEWLVPNWATYAKLNFELPDPGPEGCLRELRKMVADKATPDYKGGKKGGEAKPIPSRPLGDLEHAKLRGLLELYEKKWADMGAMGQALSSQINASAEDVKDTVREEAAAQNDVLAAIAHAVGAGPPGDKKTQQKIRRIALAKLGEEIKAEQAQTAAGIGKMAYLRSDPTMMRFVVEKVQRTIEGTERPDDSLVLVEAAEQPLSEMQTSFAGSEASIPAPPPQTSPTDAPPGKEDTAGKEDAAMEEAADKRVVQHLRRDVVMEDAENKDAKGTWRPEGGAPEREISVESEYSVGDARFVCFRLVTGEDSGRDVSAELYRRPAAEVEMAAGAPPPSPPPLRRSQRRKQRPTSNPTTARN